MRDHAKRHVHVRIAEVDLLGTLVGHGEVGQDDIDLPGLEVLDAVRRLGRHELDLDAQVLGKAVGELDVVASVFAALVDIAERMLVAEHADYDLAASLDLVEGAEHAAGGRSAACGAGFR